ncbi:hypothetical protein PsorP6_011134 [Peronosclerospora sorghi]|uniref:Uncharacterized protein n=1 Tax=Peronosclerospora sorghi TaxID=230839 RepID=A0ACC0VXM4_9STRA|nr:hypothetical protein PsorP6_011134 [Peronosclerospora sorghi]
MSVNKPDAGTIQGEERGVSPSSEKENDEAEYKVVHKKSKAELEGEMESVNEKSAATTKRRAHACEIQELQSQRDSDAESADKTTSSLKEMAETLEIACEHLNKAEAREVCADEEHEAALKVLGEMKSQSEAQRPRWSNSKSGFSHSRRESDAETAEKTKDRHGAELATKDEIIPTLKYKLEEVMAANKRLKGHFKYVQDKLTHETAKNYRLTTSLEALTAKDVSLAAKLEAVQVGLAVSRPQSSVMSEESRQQSERAADAVAQHEVQIEVLMKRVSVSDEELAQTRRQHAIQVQ